MDDLVKNKESEKTRKDKYLDLDRELKNAAEHEGDSDTTCIKHTLHDPKILVRGFEEWKMGGAADNYLISSIAKIG